MPTTANINIKLDFQQVLDLVKQLPKKQQQELVVILEAEVRKPDEMKLSDKETSFLKELDEALDFVNKYDERKSPKVSFKQMLNGL